tara:strand:- start:1879 stop:2151 length:273 start_codon:yes stop_codon:yes gene_type:complete
MESKMKDPISKWANDAQKREQEAILVTTSFADQGFDAIHELYEVNKYIETRLEELRKDIETYVDENYEPTIIARYDELTKIKHFINKLNQ